jgi:hypothetical protein
MVDGVMLLYHRPIPRWFKDASTVMEHVRAFGRHSRFPLWTVNSDSGFPEGLRSLDFAAIVLHYSLFGMGTYALDEGWLDYLDRTPAYKVAFFQDECTRCQRRFSFLNAHSVDCVYTCLEPSQFDKVYGRYTDVPKLVSNVPGYVSEELLEAASRFAVPDGKRSVDVGYRGRPLPPYLGRGAQEKHLIGQRFRELARDSGLRLDILGAEADRLYGDAWYRFLADCRCVLGVESGVSAFDLEDEVLTEYRELKRVQDTVALEDLRSLPRWEDEVYYRTVSPRHLEAAAFRVCQILFEGRYSGALEPMVHYIPLKKDFSNIDEVIDLVKDADVRTEIAANAHRDLIESGEWSYRRWIGGVDDVLRSGGVTGEVDDATVADVNAALRRGSAMRRGRRLADWNLRRALGAPIVRRMVRLTQPLTSHVRQLLRIPAADREY